MLYDCFMCLGNVRLELHCVEVVRQTNNLIIIIIIISSIISALG